MNVSGMPLGQAAADVITARMEAKDWDHSELARRAGCDRVKVWRMLTGVTKKFDLDTFDALAAALGVSSSTLMREVTAHQRAHTVELSAEDEADLASMRPANRRRVEKAMREVLAAEPERDEPEQGGSGRAHRAG